MKINCRVVDGVVILDLEGKIRIGTETEAVRTQVTALTEAGVQKILLNLAGVSDIDSSGLGELAGAFTTVQRRGGKLKLLKLNRRLHQLMTITKLLTIFEVFEDEKKAVASFG